MYKMRLLCVLGLLFSQLMMAQLKTVTGVISDEEGIPLPGATVVNLKTSNGVSSDFDGKFTIEVSIGESIIISYVGYTDQTIEVGAANAYNISLESDNQLDEVVVTSFGISRKSRSIAYATTKVSQEELTEVSNSNPLQSLSGKIAGVDISSPAQPGASTKVIFRGFSSITGSNSPLYVLDGSPIMDNSSSSIGSSSSFDAGSGINDIDPNNIESIDFLKGAAATALYGSKGANGVIMITTKKGTSDKIKVDITTSYDLQQVARVPHIQTQFGTGWSGKSYSFVTGEGDTAASNENGSWGAEFNGLVKPWSRVVDNQQLIKPYVALEENVREFFEIGNTLSQSVSISKRTDNTDYSFTYSGLDMDGVIPTDRDSFTKRNFGFNGGTGDDKFSLRSSVNYSHKEQKAVATGQGDDAGLGKSMFQDLIQLPNDLSLLDMKDETNVFNTAPYFYTPYTTNPYLSLKNNNTEITKDRVFGNINFNYNFSDSFSANLQVSADVENESVKRFGSIVRYPTGSPQDNAGSQEVVGAVSEANYSNSQFDTFFNLNYKTAITNDLDLDLLAGFNYNERKRSVLYIAVTDLDLPNYFEISNSAATPTKSQGDLLARTYGYYSQALLSYKNLYFLTITARQDASSTLPIANNSYFYPSASFAGIIADTNDLYLKGRVSWARVGNGTGAYQIFSTAGQSSNAAFFGTISYPFASVNASEIFGRIENQTLKPEITDEIELGFDVKLLNNKIGIDLSLYQRKTEDLIVNLPVARSTGYSTVTGNFVDMTNKGIELMISAKAINTADLKWNISYTYTKNNNNVDRVAGDDDKISIYDAYGVNYYAEEGKPMGSFYTPAPEKTDDGKIIADANTGYYTYDNTESYGGTSQRDFIMGLRNDVSYKGFKLAFSFDWKKGGLMYSYTKRLSHFVGNGIETTYNDRQPWIIPNSVVTDGIGGYVENTTAVDFEDVTAFYNTSQNEAMERGHLIDKSFIRMRDISLSYNLNPDLYSRFGITNISVSIYGKNLFLWTPGDNPYSDPETTNYGRGVRSEFGEFAANPSERTYGSSIKISL